MPSAQASVSLSTGSNERSGRRTTRLLALLLPLLGNAGALSAPSPSQQQQLSRRDVCWKAAAAGATVAGTSPWFDTQAAANDETSATAMPVIKTASGLKYIDLKPGTPDTASPAYGQLVSISYKAFGKLPGPDAKVQPLDNVDAYLYKHGNGRMIAGLDEGLHTMKVGGQRRILIPPKLGYVDVGLGPLPELPWNRWKLNNFLDDMVKVSGGTIIYEVTLNKVVDDEVDQGYYQDASLTPEEFDTLRENLRKKGNEEKLKQQAEAAAAAVQGQAAAAANRIV